MSAFNMKLETKETDLEISQKCSENVGKKCKTNRKKVNLVNRFDKEQQITSNGLGCTHNPFSGFDTKEIWNVQSMSDKKKRSKKNEDSKFLTKNDKLQERLQSSLSEETKKKIFGILNDIRLLSDVEKLFLYLQLPTGASLEEDPLKQKCPCNPLGKKAEEEGILAVTWIQSHLEEDPDTSLPKQEVYDEYQSYCEATGSEVLCAADFGKVMKQIFPAVKPRRLGTRGNSRYCYSGLRKKVVVAPPMLPNLEFPQNKPEPEETETDEAMSAVCHVLLEWAEKLLDMKFTSIKEVASYLIENMYVDNRSVAAFTLLLSSPERLEKASSVFSTKIDNKNKKSETQLHLQRKIQEKEQIKEQKRKLQSQRSGLTSTETAKTICNKKKGYKNRKFRDMNGQNRKDEKLSEPSKNVERKDDGSCESLTNNNESKTSDTNDTKLDIKKSEDINKCPSNISFQKIDNNLHSAETTKHNIVSNDDLCDNILVIDESPPKRTNMNLALPQIKTCVSQSLPGFIIVPSLSQISLKDGKSNKTPKYKRIQPKPLNVSSSMRCRTGSLGSLTLKENRSRTDGRRSSLALLNSDYNKECIEDSLRQKRVNSVSLLTSYTLKSEPEVTITEKTNHDNIEFKTEDFNKNILRFTDNSNLEKTKEINKKNKESLVLDDNGRTKRHIEDNDFEVATKKPHLDDLISSDVSSDCLSPWAKDVNNMNCDISSSFTQNSSNKEFDLINRADEVSIHALESDALIDYLNGVEDQSSNVLSNKDKFETEPELLLALNKNIKHNSLLHNEVKKPIINPEMSQLSQLRMLLEQNLPQSVTKSVRSTVEVSNSSKKPSISMRVNELIVPKEGLLDANKQDFSKYSIAKVFLRNTNPYLNEECKNKSTNETLSSNNNLNAVASYNMSQELTTDQDLLNIIGEQMPYVKTNTDFKISDKVVENLNEQPENLNSSSEMHTNLINIEHSSIQTQVPSVPPSPNTRRRAFNFMPISPRHTPIPDNFCNVQTLTCYSPISVQQPRNTVSVGVGPSQPPSNSGSPFVSPRSTPIPPSRSRHSSGQSSYSTSRQTPFQNIDSGVSSISSSPFISPQPTPIPVSRLRHNSSHGPCKTVTFSTINNNNQTMHTLSTGIGHGPLRLRHSSGPGGPPLGFSLLSPRSAPLSPLVNENNLSTFNFPTTSESRSRHNSGLTTTPLSPVSEQISAANNNSQIRDLSVNFENSLHSCDPFISDNSGKEMIGIDPRFKHTRQRHVSSSVITSQMSSSTDPLAYEVQNLLKNGPDTSFSRLDKSNRSRSVPLHEMLHNLTSITVPISSNEDLKNYSLALANKLNANISILGSNPSTSSVTLTTDSLVLHCDKSVFQPLQNDWTNLDSTSDIDMSSRKNLSGLLEAPLGDDLQTTLEDLKDCDTDFSKFAQELEQELSHNDDDGL